MNFQLIKDVVDLIEEFEKENTCNANASIDDFKKWIILNNHLESSCDVPHWIGKEKMRSAESVISTLLVHMNRYAKSYSKSAIIGSDFSSQEDFIYLINLKAFGEMSKMDLIKKNVHEKPVGMQIINRLIAKGWVDQASSELDKRSKVIKISPVGLEILEEQMEKIRLATQIVAGNLTYAEKMELINLLNKLEAFHQDIYQKNFDTEDLLDEAYKHIN
ncbi:MarR family transcriptional regulator [Empedobacter falsenii]